MDPLSEFDETSKAFHQGIKEIHESCDRIDETLAEMKRMDRPWLGCLFSPKTCPLVDFRSHSKLQCKHVQHCWEMK